ncbi:hypothetical protein Rfer_1622 [Rhodoferax ferrireducens T118]|uniref:DUF885 domain-containing protein n=1 Tax=Albidiferax ferrireducens (strain ATCC BAA-621 / DSM 15236 / T118) TaxID=338969 RepID=Q21Y00_ALBFT|nr:hypothetical protein [Rhodoferax ferrireducens]ABD69353.1 hypothetical protein Rfer_1622 [Rhodoferax ferrireducens T118]
MLGRTCLALCVLAGLAGLARAEGLGSSHWDELLKKHVQVLHAGQASEVDYAGFMADRTPLQTYLASISKVSRAEFDRWSNPTQLALYSVPLGLNVDTSSKLPARRLGIEFLDYDWRLNAAGRSDRSGKS